MTDDPTDAMLRARIRAKIERIADEELTRAGFPADVAPVVSHLTPNNAVPIRRDTEGYLIAEHRGRHRSIRYPASTVVLVNPNCTSPPLAPGTMLWKLLDTVKQHLGDRETTRRQLTTDMAVLGFPVASLSPQITALIDCGALLHRQHRIGEAY